MRGSAFAALVAAGIGAGAPAQANDSVAEIGAGGIVLGRSDEIALEREDLFISRDLVTVDYVFSANGDADKETVVAFPMPPIAASPYEGTSLPNEQDDNFLGFSVMFDGKPVAPNLQQRAFAAGIDVSQELGALGIPLMPFGDRVSALLDALPAEIAADWMARGIISEERWDAGKGWETHRMARWELRSVYWWKAVFPAGRKVRVSHRYRPAVGGTAGLGFYWSGHKGDNWDAYAAKYCMDDSFERAVERAQKSGPGLYENRIDYILTSGGNWANGTIGTFHLTVDKGAPSNLVSFCGEGVTKTAPTRFEMTAQDYYPQRDLHILLLQRIPE